MIIAACGGSEDTETPEALPLTGLYNGMDQDQLETAGYIVIAPDEPIRIGVSLALSGPDPNAALDLSQAYQLAIDDLNAEGGIRGHQVELDIQDDACDDETATTIANAFVEEDSAILAVLGGACPQETPSLTSILLEARLLFLQASDPSVPDLYTGEESDESDDDETEDATETASEPDVTCDTCLFMGLPNALQAEADAVYAATTLNVTNIAILHEDTDVALQMVETFQTTFEELGGTVALVETIQSGQTDFEDLLDDLTDEEPELIFFVGAAAEAGRFLDEMADAEIEELEDTLFLATDGVHDESFIDLAGDAAEGAYVSLLTDDEHQSANADFDAHYEEHFGAPPDDFGPLHAQAYDSVMLLAVTLETIAAEDNDGEGYLIFQNDALLNNIRSTTRFQGLTGKIACNQNGSCFAGGFQVYKVLEGEFIQVLGFGLD